MSSTREVKDAMRLTQMYNNYLYKYLIDGLVDSSLVRSHFKVEFEKYTRSSLKFYWRLYEIRDFKVPSEIIKEEQIKVLKEQVKMNDNLKQEVHKIQRSQWDARFMGGRLLMADRNLISQDFPELCACTSPDQIPLTVLCDQIIHKYDVRNERRVKDLLKWAQEQSESKKKSNMPPFIRRRKIPKLTGTQTPVEKSAVTNADHNTTQEKPEKVTKAENSVTLEKPESIKVTKAEDNTSQEKPENVKVTKAEDSVTLDKPENVKVTKAEDCVTFEKQENVKVTKAEDNTTQEKPENVKVTKAEDSVTLEKPENVKVTKTEDSVTLEKPENVKVTKAEDSVTLEKPENVKVTKAEDSVTLEKPENVKVTKAEDSVTLEKPENVKVTKAEDSVTLEKPENENVTKAEELEKPENVKETPTQDRRKVITPEEYKLRMAKKKESNGTCTSKPESGVTKSVNKYSLKDLIKPASTFLRELKPADKPITRDCLPIPVLSKEINNISSTKQLLPHFYWIEECCPNVYIHDSWTKPVTTPLKEEIHYASKVAPHAYIKPKSTNTDLNRIKPVNSSMREVKSAKKPKSTSTVSVPESTSFIKPYKMNESNKPSEKINDGPSINQLVPTAADLTQKSTSTDISQNWIKPATIPLEEVKSTDKPVTTSAVGVQETSSKPIEEDIHSVQSIKQLIQPSKNEGLKPAGQKQQPLVWSDRPHVYENKIKRSQHDLKDNLTSAESLQLRAEQLGRLDLKKERLKNALKQQFHESKKAKSSVHYFQTQEKPRVNKAIKSSSPIVMASKPQTSMSKVTPDTVHNQTSRKRPASSPVNTDLSVPTTKRAKHEPCIVLKLFREESSWNVKQVVDRC